jgi:predicted ATPase
MISKLEITNLKGIKNLVMDDFSRFNLIIGKNDAMKIYTRFLNDICLVPVKYE